MKQVFADAAYWIAILNPRDGLNAKAREVSKSLNECRILTSEMALTEVLNSLGDKGPSLREAAVRTVESLRSNANVSVVQQTSIQFRDALKRYRDRPDKDWGLTDCASFLIMEEHGIDRRSRMIITFNRQGFACCCERNNDL